MLEAIIKIIILNVSLFITLLIAIPIGVGLVKLSKGFAMLIMFILGSALMYFSFWLTDYFRDDSVYHWYYFITSAILISMMNDGNTKWGAAKDTQTASTFLFGGAVLAGIVFLFIY